MTIETELRTRLLAATDEVTGGPDLATAIGAGRRVRRRRGLVRAGGLGAATVALAGVAAYAVHTVADRPGPVLDRSVAATGSSDFVPGTQVDEQLQATIAAHLAGLGTALDVYPSDWNTDGPLPDRADFANATEWQALYHLDAHERLMVLVSKPIPGQPAVTRCTSTDAPGTPACHTTEVPGGGTLVTSGYELMTGDDHPYRFSSLYVAPDGTTVNVIEEVAADSWSQATALRALDDAHTTALAQDPDLTFPDPVVTPAPPSGP